MSRITIGTSWKMNLTPSQAADWLATARPLLEPIAAERDLFVLPPFPALHVTREQLAGSPIGWGGQDIHPDDRGAHTGDVSGEMLADLGCRYAEIGHSERRRDHGETDAIVAAKVGAALRWTLTPIVCVGELDAGPVDRARPIVLGQLDGALGDLPPAELDRVIVAYEPVWAIGQGALAADPVHVSALHLAIDGWLADHGATTRRVLYGGSVDEENAPELLGCDGVAGLFVGRAALNPLRFAAIAATSPLTHTARAAAEPPAEPALERSA